MLSQTTMGNIDLETTCLPYLNNGCIDTNQFELGSLDLICEMDALTQTNLSLDVWTSSPNGCSDIIQLEPERHLDSLNRVRDWSPRMQKQGLPKMIKSEHHNFYPN